MHVQVRQVDTMWRWFCGLRKEKAQSWVTEHQGARGKRETLYLTESVDNISTVTQDCEDAKANDKFTNKTNYKHQIKLKS